MKKKRPANTRLDSWNRQSVTQSWTSKLARELMWCIGLHHTMYITTHNSTLHHTTPYHNMYPYHPQAHAIRITLPHHTTLCVMRITIPRHATPHHTMYHTIPHHTILHVSLYHTTPDHTTPHHTAPYGTTLWTPLSDTTSTTTQPPCTNIHQTRLG